MKTPLDPRHQQRLKTVKNLFCWSFQENQKIKDILAEKVLENQKKIDETIKKAAPEWPIKQINRIDLAILRLAVFELLCLRKEPHKVIIDEAIELAKYFGGEKSPPFVNGVLGTILKAHLQNEKS